MRLALGLGKLRREPVLVSFSQLKFFFEFFRRSRRTDASPAAHCVHSAHQLHCPLPRGVAANANFDGPRRGVLPTRQCGPQFCVRPKSDKGKVFEKKIKNVIAERSSQNVESQTGRRPTDWLQRILQRSVANTGSKSAGFQERKSQFEKFVQKSFECAKKSENVKKITII